MRIFHELHPGTVVTLEVVREAPFGYFLSDGESDVLLHRLEMKGEVEIGQKVEVYLYQDKMGRLAATMSIPTIQQGTYGWAKVENVKHNLGAFVDIGISKGILVTKDDLPKFKEIWPQPGDQLYITVKEDEHGRLFGRLATEEVIQGLMKPAPAKLHQTEIQGRVYRLLKTGTFLITEEGYRCFVHESERREEPRLGQLVTGRVIMVKDDGTLNVSLLPKKLDKMDQDSNIIFTYLELHHGAMPYGDKSDPDEIQRKFKMSKASFKRALGRLMKEGKIEQKEGWTYLKRK